MLWPEGTVDPYLEDGYPHDWYFRGPPDVTRILIANVLGPRDRALVGGTALMFDRQDNITGAGNAIFGAIINAVKSDSQSNILSTPSIMTLDNQEAKILVGQEIPVTTGEALSNNFDNAFRTVQRQNVGIQLEVKPQINEAIPVTPR